MIPKLVLISVLLVLSVNVRAKPSVVNVDSSVNSNINNDQNKVSAMMLFNSIIDLIVIRLKCFVNTVHSNSRFIVVSR